MIATLQPIYVAKIKRANEPIWKDLICPSSYSLEDCVGECFYVYEVRMHQGQRFYSLQRTMLSEPIGWMSEGSLMLSSYTEISRDEQIYHFSGTGVCYTHPNGGRMDQLYPALRIFEGQAFLPLETVQVGNNIWHRGKIGDTSAWVQAVHLV